MDDIRRHLNNIRNAAIENLNWQEWLDELQQYTEITNEDLDDLPDSKGVIQIGLSWNSTADIDLHVMDPFNETIYFDNPTSSSGGYLDRDDTDGLGPENIYWTENIPDGRYTVSLVYYGPSDGPVSDFTVRVINGLGASETFSGALGYFEGTSIPIVTFTKNGNSIVF